ncbi:class I SAM-dependent methyltransferase [Methanococcoides methylutens]|uniref:class I SAM-dependent methyltransferase n=1 Tax=Methanococcoides methylutens TaxID=2226 RepID=UPI0040441DFD
MVSDIFLEIFDRLPRQGPGKNECTKKAFTMLSGLPARPHIIDIGCGSGMQTLLLAELSGGKVDALDLYRIFLEDLNERAIKKGISDKIRTCVGSMTDLPYERKSFDLIWAEGSIYIMGFKEGLSYWKQFLKKGGYICVTEINWLTDQPSEKALSYWNNYPEVAMKTVEENKETISELGLDCIDTFVLPESAWWDDYYNPLEIRLGEMKKKYPENADFTEFSEEIYAEMEVYKECSADYGYVFYIMKKKE